MPAYSFQKRFVPLIESGEKYTTIRKPRKRPTMAGDVLYLYTGMRTKACLFIGRAVCDAVRPIWIYPEAKKCEQMDANGHCYLLNDKQVSWVAKRDGFNSADDFFAWFGENHKGDDCFEIIKWSSFLKPIELLSNRELLEITRALGRTRTLTKNMDATLTNEQLEKLARGEYGN